MPVKVAFIMAAFVLICRQETDALYTDDEKGFSIPVPKGWWGGHLSL